MKVPENVKALYLGYIPSLNLKMITYSNRTGFYVKLELDGNEYVTRFIGLTSSCHPNSNQVIIKAFELADVKIDTGILNQYDRCSNTEFLRLCINAIAFDNSVPYYIESL